MNTKRLNITLPLDVMEDIKDIKNKSAFITNAIREHSDKERKQRLTALLQEGYIATKEEDKKINAEWGHTISDGSF
jgi:metal-responsive CopG/Arc/MetJ family transcriptional regulator